jgi:hypothetical protein
MNEGNYCQLNVWHYVQDEVQLNYRDHWIDSNRYVLDYCRLDRVFQDDDGHDSAWFDCFHRQLFRQVSIDCRNLCRSNDMKQHSNVSIVANWEECRRDPNNEMDCTIHRAVLDNNTSKYSVFIRVNYDQSIRSIIENVLSTNLNWRLVTTMFEDIVLSIDCDWDRVLWDSWFDRMLSLQYDEDSSI